MNTGDRFALMLVVIGCVGFWVVVVAISRGAL